MADVVGRRLERLRGQRGRRGERGQLILVTGLLVAVAMVALVLLLNTAIYTENLASRGADQSGREAVEYRTIVIGGVGELIDAENDREHGSWAAVNGSVVDGIERIDNLTSRSYAIDETIVRINQSAASLTTTEGRLVRQTADRQFLNETTATDWTLATSVEDTRSVRLTVIRDDLRQTEGDQARTNGAFQVNLTGADEWQAFVYNNSTTGEVSVATATGGTPTEVCSAPGPRVTVDLTRGTIAGEPCPGLTWADGITGSYDLGYENGDDARGTYNLTINGTSTVGANLNDGRTTPTSPYWVPAVYSASFEIYYESRSLTYRSSVRVAPGESG